MYLNKQTHAIALKILHNKIFIVVLMAKTAISGKTNPVAFALELIGSVIYLVLSYATGTGTGAMGAFYQAVSTVWLPVLYAVGVLSAVVLFLVSFTNLMRHNPLAKAGVAPALLGGFAFVGITAGNFGYFGLALIGFVIAIIGATYGKLASA